MVSGSFPYPLRFGLSWTRSRQQPLGSVVAALDPRANALASLLQDAFAGFPTFIWGAGASVPLVATRLSGQSITAFVKRQHLYVEEPLVRGRLPILAAILGARLEPRWTEEEIRSALESRATELRLDPVVYKDLLHLLDGALQALLYEWLSPDPGALKPGPHRSGYDILGHVPPGSVVITTNQERLVRRLAPHLHVVALNGEVPRAFVDPDLRAEALTLLATTTHVQLPAGFVPFGQQQPSEVTDTEDFWAAWQLTTDASAVVIVGYSFAGGLDVGCWDEFRRQTGQEETPVHIVDPDSAHVAEDVAYGMSHHPPLAHPFAWNRLSYAVAHLLSRYDLAHPSGLLPHVRELVRLHDEMDGVDPKRWDEVLATGMRGMRPKSFRG